MSTRRAEVLFIGDAASVVRAAKQAEVATNSAASGISRGHKNIASSFASMAKSAVMAGAEFAAAYASIEGVKKAVEATKSMTEETVTLTRMTGLNTQAASAYAAVAQVNGISNQKLGQSMGTLAKNVRTAVDAHEGLTKSAKAQEVAFKQLGIPIKTLVKDHGDMNLVMNQVTAAFTRMHPGVTKTGVAMALFGRGWQTLVPLMKQGELGLKAQLEQAKMMGATLGGKPIESLEQLAVAQNKAKYATLGLQLAIGQYLAPAITSVLTWIDKLVVGFRTTGVESGKIHDFIQIVIADWKLFFAVVSDVVGAIERFAARVPAAFASVKQTVHSVVAGIVATVTDGFNTINGVVSKTTGWISAAFNTVATELRSWSTVWSVVNTIGTVVTTTFHVITTVITTAVNILGPIVKTAFNLMVSVVRVALNGIVAIVRPVLALIGNLFSVGFAAARVIVETVFNVMAIAAQRFVTEFMGVVRLVGDLLKGKWGAAWDEAKHIVSTAIGTMLSIVKTIFGEIPKAINSVGGAIFSAVKTIITAPLSWIKGLFNTVYDIGKYLIQGLIKGIESLGSAVGSTLKGIVHGAWKGVTGFLGISSPSKLFHDVGANTMQGLIDGINSKVPNLTKARGAVLTTFSGLAKGVGTLMGGSASAVDKGSTAIYGAVKSMMSSLGGTAPKSPGLDISGVMASVVGAVTGAVGAVGGLLGQHATGGKVSKPMFMVGEEAPQHPEFVLATNPSYRKRNLGLWAQAGQQLGVPGFAQGGIAAMTAEANLINSKHYPYVWGGGHNAGFTGPYDCSGSVSAVLHAAGLLNAPEVSGQLMNYGLPGPGAVTIYANPAHTFMSIMGKFFGTHGSSGAGWYAGSARPGFAVRHAPVGAGGSIGTPRVSGGGTYGTIAQNALKRVAGAANSMVGKAFASMTAGGGIGGGDWGTFGPVSTQVFDFFSGNGFDKMAIAGILGNASQESGLNPNTPGGGMWQQISNFGSGTGGSLLSQMRTMLPQILGLRGAMNAASSPGAAATIFEQGFERAGIPAMSNRIAAANAAYAAGYATGGVLPYVGSYKRGGTVPADGMAHVHRNETIIPAYASGGVVGKAMHSGFLFPLDAAIQAITDLIARLQGPAPTHGHAISRLQNQLTDIRKAGIDLPVPAAGKAGDSQRIKNAKARKQYAAETLDIEVKIRKLKADDKAAKAEIANEITRFTLQSKNLTQLKGFREAIASIRDQVKGLTASAAQAWRTLQETGINKAHDLAIKAVGSSPAALLLAAMQSQDATAANAATLTGLNKNLTDAQFLAAHSGGQTHLDALQQVKDAQAAIDAFNRQQTEQQLQDAIAADTKKADDAQAVALAGLDKQQADYQASLDAQLGALTNSLAKRTLTYAAWAKDVDAVLAQYGLSASTDAGTEITLTLGPPKKAKGKKKSPRAHIARAAGGPVLPGYVYRVGEQGAEDVMFGHPGVVMTAAQSRRGGTVHIEKAYFTGTSAARAFADRLAFRAAIGTA